MKTTFLTAQRNSRFFKVTRQTSLLLAALVLAGCPSGNQTPEPTPPAANAGTKVVIRGSNTIGEELAPALIAEFKKDHAKTEFNLETKGTSYGMGSLMGGQCDIAGASREPLKEELEVAKFRGVELNDYVIGAYSVAVVVNAANAVGDLSREQVQGIFTGAITNWKDVGGADAPITIHIRDEISGTYLGFKELAMGNKPYGPAPQTHTSYGAIAQAVAKDANGIGYTSVSTPATVGVKMVKIGGLEPGNQTVNAGQYPYARVLHLYTNKAGETAVTQEFIKFVLSKPGQEVLTKAGFTPKS
ncbi:MAG: phosphate ABC transporter substrate-binding protein [Verrucomicrobia bacterium]|nr:MAG: phosphate ABC transporter substrate-binding protein [Verrucomicrobiota bacterium]